jgi:hypothetical protein
VNDERHRIVFLASRTLTPIDVVQRALGEHPSTDDLEKEHARQALLRLAECLGELLRVCEDELTDTEKIARIEASLVKLYL